MRVILLSVVLLTGCAGTQTLKGYNNAEPQEVVAVEETAAEVEESGTIVNPWLTWALTVLSLSLLAWYMFDQRKDNLE